MTTLVTQIGNYNSDTKRSDRQVIHTSLESANKTDKFVV